MAAGHIHEITCRCILSQLKGLASPPKYAFLVFSIVDDHGDVVQKYVQCPNCGLVHKVYDFCKSEILAGKEDLKSNITVEDIKSFLPKRLSDILEKYTLEIAVWEKASFIYENKLWGEYIVLTSDYLSNEISGKYLIILGDNLFKVESFTRNV